MSVFHADATAVPVIGGLGRGVLQQVEFGVKADGGGSAPAALAGISVAQQGPYLVEQLGHALRLGELARNTRWKHYTLAGVLSVGHSHNLSRYLKIGMTRADKEI